jgi:hypothetical protein
MQMWEGSRDGSALGNHRSNPRANCEIVHSIRAAEKVERARRLIADRIGTQISGAATHWGWQWLFPANSLCRDPYTGLPTRHHQHEKM